MSRKTLSLVTRVAALTCVLTVNGLAADQHIGEARIKAAVDRAIRPLRTKDQIPGIAVGVTVQGRDYFFNYGVASRQTGRPVTRQTLFEIGSLSKTFAATLAAEAQIEGRLSLSERVGQRLPALRGSGWADARLRDLGTHTAGLPQFAPDTITTTDQLLASLRHSAPAHAAGTHRLYSNIGVGLLGLIAATSLHESYDDALEHGLFPALGMTHSYLQVPPDRMPDYAQGYTAKNVPIRLKAGVLASEAYGVKSCTADLLRFLRANMPAARPSRTLERAMVATHTPYLTAGALTQDLAWEQYPVPVSLTRLLAGSAAATSQDAVATPLTPSQRSQTDVLINKTGSTNGFAAYIAFLPARKIGIVILANKSTPIDQRVTAAYRILTRLDRHVGSKD